MKWSRAKGSRSGITKACKTCGKEFYAVLSVVDKRHFCSKACSVESYRFKPEQFWARVDQSAGPDACWPFTGPRIYDGYGIVNVMGTRIAHRLAWILTHGNDPKGLQVCHHCDNRICCNPKHLFVGDHKANADDRVAKGRGTWGSQCKQSSLTAEQVQEILRDYRRPSYRVTNAKELAAKYGVTPGSIHAIANGRTWKRLHASGVPNQD